jgi:cyclophilin family peptidyl-prolyl cis-trans isomerase
MRSLRSVCSILALVVVAALGAKRSGAEEAAKEQPVSGGVAAIEKFIAEQKIEKQGNWKVQVPRPPKVAFAPGQHLFWRLETNVGDVKIKLMPDVAPMHVSSTVYLTKLGFYDDVVFHRVIPGFMAQGGDPTGTGTGGPAYKYAGETDPKVKHDRGGLLSMANAGPGTDGSQFFLTFVATPWLDGKHTIFGEVVEGQGTLKELEKRGSQGGRTSERLVIERATIETE